MLSCLKRKTLRTCKILIMRNRTQNNGTRLSLLGDTNSLSPTASGLGVLPTHSKTPVVTEATMVSAIKESKYTSKPKELYNKRNSRSPKKKSCLIRIKSNLIFFNRSRSSLSFMSNALETT